MSYSLPSRRLPERPAESEPRVNKVTADYLEIHERLRRRRRASNFSAASERLRNQWTLRAFRPDAAIERFSEGDPAPEGYPFHKESLLRFWSIWDRLANSVGVRPVNMQRHRHQEFIRFLNTIEVQVPVGK